MNEEEKSELGTIDHLKPLQKIESDKESNASAHVS